MSDEARSKLGAQIERGDRAAKLLGDPLIADAFAAVDREIYEKWSSTDNDLETRERAYLMQRLLRNLRGQFEAHVKTGRLASKQLWALEEREKTLRERMGRKIRRGQ